jgi:hypothetical protein
MRVGVAKASIPAQGWRANFSVFIALTLCTVSVLAIYVANRSPDILSVGEPLGVAGAVLLFLIAFRRWQYGVQALLVIVIMEGAVRKWFLPSYADVVYFYKDALMGMILLGYFFETRKSPQIIRRDYSLLLVGIVGLSIYCFGVVTNPRAPHFITSLFGIKAYCLYMALAFLVPRMFPTKESFVRFLRWYLVIVLMVSAVGIWQSFDNSGASSLNRYAVNESSAGAPQDTAIFIDSSGDDLIRVTSTFSFISGLTVYLPVAFALLLGLTAMGANKALPLSVRLIYYFAIAGVVVTAFLSGSRGVIVNLALIAVVFFVFTSLKNAFRRLRQVVVGGLLVFLALYLIAPQAVDGVYQRGFGGETQIDEGRERIESVFSLPFAEANYSGPFGYGVGATQNSVPALMNRLQLTPTGEKIPIDVESEPGRVMLELGVVGFILFSFMRIAILFATLRACLLIKDLELKGLAIACFATLLFFVVVGGAVINHTQNVYQWFLVGMVFALLNADRLALRSARQAILESTRMVNPLRFEFAKFRGSPSISR